MANEIIGNKNYYEVSDLELKLTFRKVGYKDTQKPSLT